MNQRMTALERAFQLARSGHVWTVSEIEVSLSRDGYSANSARGSVFETPAYRPNQSPAA